MRRFLKWTLLVVVLAVIAVAAWPFIVGDMETRTLDVTERARLSGERGFEFVQLSEGVTCFQWAGPPDAPVVVLVHGFTGPSAVWDHNFHAIAEAGYRVLRYDLFGRGYSDRPHLRYSADVFDHQLLEMLDAFHVETAAIVGLSMGGAQTVHFVDRHPERVSAFALLAPAGFSVDIPPAYAVLGWPGVGEWVMRAFGDRKLPGAMLRMGIPEGAPYRMDFMTQMTYTGYKRALLSTYRNNPLLNLEPVYRRVGQTDIPAALIWGTADHVLPFEHTQRVKEAIPHIEVHAIEGGSHTACYEMPDQVNPILIEFLQRALSAQPPQGEIADIPAA
jgi:pimeloyl-ACP methyl ester carboxylesterase